MGHKKQRLLDCLRAPEHRARYDDVHIFIGGTGAVGGTALLKMLELYEELFSLAPPGPDQVPVLVATGRTQVERKLFKQRLFRHLESRHGASLLPTRVRSGYLTASGVFVALEPFELEAFGELDRIRVTPRAERAALVERYLGSIGASRGEAADRVAERLAQAAAQVRPIGGFLARYRAEHFAERERFRFRSVTIGIPLPSFVAYHLEGIELAAREIAGLAADHLEELKEAFVRGVRDDLARIQSELAEHVVVAHTTSVGGMYDEEPSASGARRTIRLGFSHSAQDDRLLEKQRFAERLTALYADAGIRVLITAAAIGVDEVRLRQTVPLHPKIAQMLREHAADAPAELFPRSVDSPVVHVFPPVTLPLDGAPDRALAFPRQRTGDELRPACSIRSGENGFFSVANAEALYRVMRVASASELGFLLARIGLFGDDPQSPWFEKDNVCYYRETDNARQVLDFLAQPMLRQVQLSGLEPMALQDLGSAKHQAELHTLALLILLHRLRTLDIDSIPPYVDVDRFDARGFFEAHSRPLTFEDLDGWEVGATAADLPRLALADRAEELVPLKPFRPLGRESLFPEKGLARLKVLRCVLDAVWQITSLGTPLVVESGGATWLRTGYFVAPLDLLVTRADAVERWLRERHRASGNPCSPADYRDHQLAVAGFVDLRPHAIVCDAKNDRADLTGRVRRARDVEELRAALAGVTPYGFFATCGLVAVLHRLRSLYALLKEALLELGTLHEFRWQMPRDENGHIVVLPGAVEALRMVAEGLEKTTGTEWLDGPWGYERRRVPDRRPQLLPRP